jgi:hypothetical protein
VIVILENVKSVRKEYREWFGQRTDGISAGEMSNARENKQKLEFVVRSEFHQLLRVVCSRDHIPYP